MNYRKLILGITAGILKRTRMRILAILSISFMILTMVPSCNNTPIPTPFFPSLREPLNAYPPASGEGKLILENGCLRLKYSNGESSFIIWPYGFSVRVEGNSVQVINDKGQIVTSVGDELKIGGGEISVDIVEKLTGQKLPDNCPGPYWLAGDVVSATNTTRQSNTPGKSEPTPPTTETEMYARRLGITIEEAERRFKLQEAAGKLQAELSNKEVETFAGLWIEHTPTFKVIVQFTRNGEETVKPYLQPDLAAVVEVRTAKYSYLELQNAQNQAISSLRSLGIQFDSAIDVSKNHVLVKVKSADRANFENAIRDGKLVLPDSVEVIWTDSLATPLTFVGQE